MSIWGGSFFIQDLVAGASMVCRTLEGKKVAEATLAALQQKESPSFYPPLPFDRLPASFSAPSLHIVRVGEDPASGIYVRRKQQVAQQIGLKATIHRYSALIEQQELITKLHALSGDRSVTALLLQLPLPRHLDPLLCIDAIDPTKDVDGLTSSQLGRLVVEHPQAMIPCTPLGIWALLRAYNLPLLESEVVVIGRSRIVGRPLELLLSSKQSGNSTITLLHSQSLGQDKARHREVTRRADILILAAGAKELVDASWIKEGACVVDVGIHAEGASLVGDGQASSLRSKAAFLSPVPGGVGPMTVASLMYNCWRLKLLQELSAPSQS